MELTIIKRGDAAYIDSREVAAAIGKDHRNLLRDIRGYCEIFKKSNELKIELITFFAESSYVDSRGREKLCYLLTKQGCELCANKLTGAKGVLFTAAYVAKFNAMEQRERAAQIAEIEAKSATPQLRVFNTAVRNVLSGFSQTYSAATEVVSFLHGAYKPFGIAVAPLGDNDNTLNATDIARMLGVYSENGLPHAHAVAKIIENLNLAPEHIEIAPYGLVGINMRYDFFVYRAVRNWLAANGYPHDIPHLDFKYHIYYDRRFSRYNDDEIDLNEEMEYDSDDDDEDWDFGDED